MNRRRFIKGIAGALAGFNILPGAGRLWRAERLPIYRCVMELPILEHDLYSMDSAAQKRFVESFFFGKPLAGVLWGQIDSITTK